MIDSDGTITFKDKNRPCIRIITTDKWLVQEIKDTLIKFNYHVVLYKKEKHDKTYFGKKPIYELEISKNREVMELLSQIPFRHEEKIKKAMLLLKLRKKRLAKAWEELANEIKSNVMEYQRLAKISIKS